MHQYFYTIGLLILFLTVFIKRLEVLFLGLGILFIGIIIEFFTAFQKGKKDPTQNSFETTVDETSSTFESSGENSEVCDSSDGDCGDGGD